MHWFEQTVGPRGYDGEGIKEVAMGLKPPVPEPRKGEGLAAFEYETHGSFETTFLTPFVEAVC